MLHQNKNKCLYQSEERNNNKKTRLTLTLVTLFSKNTPRTKTETQSRWVYSQHRHMQADVLRSPHQINSLQWKQKVGWRRYVDMNLCPLTWWILRRTAPCRCLVNCLWFFSLTTASSENNEEKGNKKIMLFWTELMRRF